MKVIKYVVKLQMVYSTDNRSLIDTIAEFDTFENAITELENIARIYTNDKNVAIEVIKYEFDKVDLEYEYLEVLIGFYGVDAAKYLNIRSKRNKNKYGLIV